MSQQFAITGEGAAVTRVRVDQEELAKQEVHALFGVTAESTPSQHLSLMLTSIPPASKTKVHHHIDHESALYTITGTVHFYWGENLENLTILEPGDFCYIPPFTAHVSYNPSRSITASFATARTDAREQERVQLLPELEGLRDDQIEYVD